MASSKDIFEAKIFGADLFASGVFRGRSWTAPTCTISADVTMPANSISTAVTMPANTVTGDVTMPANTVAEDVGIGCGNQG